LARALVRHLIRETAASVLNVDALTYAANLTNLAEIENERRYAFRKMDICSAGEVEHLLKLHPR
jgi:dTDP-glucose 4,6-dehydratase